VTVKISEKNPFYILLLTFPTRKFQSGNALQYQVQQRCKQADILGPSTKFNSEPGPKLI